MIREDNIIGNHQINLFVFNEDKLSVEVEFQVDVI